MQPKTKLQNRVVELSSKLPAITEKQKVWAFEKCFDNYVVRSRNTLYCLECGHSWKDLAVLVSSICGCACPNCGEKLKMCTSYDRVLNDSAYFAIITTKGDMQVVRIFWVSKLMKKLKVPYCSISEVMQHWIDPTGKVETLSKKVQSFTQCFDQWVFDSELEIRSETRNSCLRYGLGPYKIYPGKSILPVIKRNGFNHELHGFTPHNLFSCILRDPKVETLLKAGQFEMLLRSQSSDFDKYWPSVKICIRNGYIIKDASMWCDHINMLKDSGKDIHNAKYVCPADLKAAHGILIEKRRIIWEREEFDKQVKKIAKLEEEFKKEKGNFFGIQFSDGLIDVIVLDNIREYLIEGNELHHCVFSGKYYNRPNSLILSARKGDKRLETIEVSLKTMDVVQCRGLLNENTEYHDQIVNLVRKNINVIQKIKRTNQ